VITRRIYTVAFSSGDKPMILPGKTYHDVSSELYVHPDRQNGARMWYKFAHQCEDAEGRGKLKKLPKGKDNVHLSINAFKAAGDEL
jgi:hypothetical protein